ncbi:PHB/PHA accumulation regulator DNA-binding domain protein [Pseudovibrio axinellae]|uniref:PHB/PHA accumulation regulator DNA-binding domain protein n=1 Tax=Pseudovibrio axinellae TaxID=989403 RepID=A0A166AZ21_9HYPH|nr:polyhydroxyalkanoate synthesis repressor PhaR [Pseudovibrio axinellae]KZL21736.1 PHB/PHA accumulation regulator DNA-binding domain protein [Pseudovibrio axinellae]SEQ21440.1 polyhydroxyalkanoate synthesis repressor PhaR [Pseudovibrio axinellae]
MAKTSEATIIKKYANRRLYNTGTSSYVTLEDLAVMVKDEEDFVVIDAKSGDDITRSVLTQIIFEQESKGQNLLPIAFLRQLIRFYGDSMQNLVPSYLEFSMSSLTREQEKLRSQMNQSFGTSAFEVLEDQVKRNADIFDRAIKMFLPFEGGDGSDAPASPKPQETNAAQKPAEKQASSGDISDLKEQLAEMQKQIAALAATKKDS